MRLRREPLFIQIAEILRSEIVALEVGTKLDTDQGLARRFSVSVSVIREALSILSREKLVLRKVGRGTFVAERVPVSSRPIALLCDLDLYRMAFPRFMLQRIQVAKQMLESRGLEVAVYLGDHLPGKMPPSALTCRQFIKDLSAKRLGGVLSLWAIPHMEWADLVREQGIPHVGFGLLHENMVSYDFETYLRYALRILKSRGRRKISYISGPGEWNLDEHDLERRKKIPAIFRQEGVEVRNAWMVQEWHRTEPGAGWAAFREIWTSHSDRPNAVILGNSAFLQGVRSAAQSLMVDIPTDLEVVIPRNSTLPASDDVSSVIPIHFDPVPMIEESVRMIMAFLSGKTPESCRQFVDVWERPRLPDPLTPSLFNPPL